MQSNRRNIEEVHKYLTIAKFEMEIDFFSYEWWLHVLDEFRPAKEVQIKELSYGKENVKISIVSTVDNQYIEHFEYSTLRSPQEGVNINTYTLYVTDVTVRTIVKTRRNILVDSSPSNIPKVKRTTWLIMIRWTFLRVELGLKKRR